MFETLPPSTDDKADDGCSFMIKCGIPTLGDLLTRYIEQARCRNRPDADTHLVVDAPIGFAFHYLATLDQGNYHVIVVTSNTCPEYWEDLWAFAPAILLVGSDLLREVSDAVWRAAKGERYRLTPASTTQLTPLERLILQRIARGWRNYRIAQDLGLEPKTVQNNLTNVYAKLQLAGRVEAALYYWGCHDLLDH